MTLGQRTLPARLIAATSATVIAVIVGLWIVPTQLTQVGSDTTILAATGRATQAAVTLVRGPYLQQTGDSQTVVVWSTRQSGAASVEYRTGTDAWRSVPATTVFRGSSATGIPDYYQHEATIVGLLPSTAYEYDLRLGGVDPTPGVIDRFSTAPTAGSGTIRLIAFGDSGDGSTAQAQIATRIAGDTFDLALHTGDIAYSRGTYAQYEAKFFGYYHAWLRRRPFFPSIGNHDDFTNSATPYRTLFALPRHGASAAHSNNAERFYSFDYGPVHFVALDTEAAFLSSARREAQLAWLAADLAAAQDQPWRIAFFHRPAYSAGSHGSDLAVRQAFGPLFEQYRVQLVLTGHDHTYERTVPLREGTDLGRQAVTYLVTGGSGAELYFAGRQSWTAFSRAVHHYLRATISPDEARFEAVSSTGAVIDSFTLDRALQQSDAAAPTVSIASPGEGATLSGVEPFRVEAGDDTAVVKVDLWIDGQLRAAALTAPYDFTVDTTALASGAHTIEARAYDLNGRRASASRTYTVDNGVSDDIVLYASETTRRQGAWRVVADPSAAGGSRLEQPDAAAATVNPPLSNPTHFVEYVVDVAADTDYRMWMRARAAGNSGYNDSIWVQSSGTVDDTGAATFRIGSTSGVWLNLQDCSGCGVSGWGWQDTGYGAGVLGPVLRFSAAGIHTIRVQAREDGVSIDQLVLSPSTYLTRSPGATRNDTTILPK